MYDITVVGGGLVGASFALATIKQNPSLKIAIIDRAPSNFNEPDSFDSKIYAISPLNIKKLMSLDITPNISRFGTIDAMDVKGNQNSQIQFNKKDGRSDFLSRTIEYGNLQNAIITKLQEFSGIKFIYTDLNNIEMDDISVKLYDVNTNLIETKYVVAADGANSFIRNKSNFNTEKIDYYQSGIVANFKVSKPHHNTAHQWFNGAGVLAYLPLPDDKISIVWSTDRVDELLSLTSSEFAAAVSNEGNYILGNLELISKPTAFPLKLNLVDKFYDGKIILIGDAAHTIHPLAGQGVNIGFGDAWLLADIMAKSSANLDASTLVKFNTSRMLEVRQMQMTCHLLHRLFHNRNTIINLIRNFGLNLVNQNSFIKKRLISAAINF